MWLIYGGQNMTGPGRPGRDDQTSLVGLAAAELGWDYSRLLAAILGSARTLQELRDASLPDLGTLRTSRTGMRTFHPSIRLS